MRHKKTNKEWGLEVKSFPKHKQWAICQDYVHKLSKEERDWLGQFNQEYYRNSIKKNDPNSLHNTDELRRDCYARENAANRDLYAIKSVGGAIIGDFTVIDDNGHLLSVLDNICDVRSIIDTESFHTPLKSK